ncbi:AarF/UbiB family protein, partial [Streptococcus pneumoniae]|uniref:AarF/UbiB family protein n=1 Tax=Streptococcus pneumoniae TaxID=1313 RepID=UPI003D662FC3
MTAPKVHHRLSTKKVLVMDLLIGKSLVDESLVWDGTAGKDSKKIMNDVLDTWFLSLMMTGEFHADLHAGNLMLL